jgi:hypothetical protein
LTEKENVDMRLFLFDLAAHIIHILHGTDICLDELKLAIGTTLPTFREYHIGCLL